MRAYRQLTENDRIEIYAMKQAGKQQNKIAAVLGVHPGTVSRELTRNAGLRGYRPKQAQQKASHRRFTVRKAVKMTPGTIAYIECKLGQEHSPEQIQHIMDRLNNRPGKSLGFLTPNEVSYKRKKLTG